MILDTLIFPLNSRLKMVPEMDLEAYLRNAGIWHRFIEKPETVHTADASRETGIQLTKITKNLVCKTDDGQYGLLVIPGDRRVNLQDAAKALGTRNIQLVAFSEAESVSGYPPGGTPSIYHKTPLKVVIEENLLLNETIYCGGGARNRLLELKTKDIVKLTNAVAAAISK